MASIMWMIELSREFGMLQWISTLIWCLLACWLFLAGFRSGGMDEEAWRMDALGAKGRGGSDKWCFGSSPPGATCAVKQTRLIICLLWPFDPEEGDLLPHIRCLLEDPIPTALE